MINIINHNLNYITIIRRIKRVRAKNLATLLFLDFSKAFDSLLRGKMEQILLAYGLPKATFTAIMMLYSNMKAKVSPPDGDTDFIDIVVGVLQKDTFAPYPFIICQYEVLRTSIHLIKENDFTLKKARSIRYLAETIMDPDYSYPITLLANTLAQA